MVFQMATPSDSVSVFFVDCCQISSVYAVKIRALLTLGRDVGGESCLALPKAAADQVLIQGHRARSPCYCQPAVR